MYIKVDYSLEAKKNYKDGMAGEYAIYTKRHFWNKWKQRSTYASLNLCISDAKNLVELPKYFFKI